MKITIETHDKKTIAKINEILPRFMEFVANEGRREPHRDIMPTPQGLVFELDERYLSTGTINALKMEGIYDLRKLVRYSAAELRRKPRFGVKAIMEINDLLLSNGMKLQDDPTH